LGTKSSTGLVNSIVPLAAMASLPGARFPAFAMAAVGLEIAG
jgi:hypothetical protein